MPGDIILMATDGLFDNLDLGENQQNPSQQTMYLIFLFSFNVVIHVTLVHRRNTADSQ